MEKKGLETTPKTFKGYGCISVESLILNFNSTI